MIDALMRYLESHYTPADYPTIAAQVADFSARRPFEGLRILDATPLFFNTLAKYLPLLSGGAHLTLSGVEGVPQDPNFVAWARQEGLPVITTAEGDYDLISDCIGLHAGMNPRLGFAELTHSGLARYEGCSKPCFDSDSSKIKEIEAILGTGDGLIRGLGAQDMQVDKAQRWLLFGFGKIGRGIAMRLRHAGAEVVVVEAAKNRSQLKGAPGGDFPFIDMSSVEAVRQAVEQASHIVTATSVPHVISQSYPIEPFLRGQILINMGAEDEYGPRFAPQQVLNGKVALNFALEEPTHLRYIETTFALQNAGLEWIIKNKDQSGITQAPSEIQQTLIATLREKGRINTELTWIDL